MNTNPWTKIGRLAERSEAQVTERSEASEAERGAAVFAGCLSGTSADGMDVALVRFGPPSISGPGPDAGSNDARSNKGVTDVGDMEVLGFQTLPFEPALAARLRAVLDGAPLDARGLALLDRDLGVAFGRAARETAEHLGEPLHVVASHGQTIWHHDGRDPAGRATLQLGNPDFCAEAARASVVSGFRDGDVAAGGEGAPLSALADERVFAHAKRPLAILNLGGLANLTLLGSDGGVEAFDTGPAGCLLDGLSRRLLDRPFDPEGEVAARGRADPTLLTHLLGHAFFAQVPPKSTGRDTFGEAWIDEWVTGPAAQDLRPEDLLATAVELVAESVARGLRAVRVVQEPFRGLVLCGGGHRHLPLVAALARRVGLPTLSSSSLGVDPDAREALVFAVLGARMIAGVPSTRSSVTGASAGRILGRLTLFGPR